MKSPAFQFYPADFLSDENVMTMTNQEVGCYIKLICFCWKEGSIPSDISLIARLCGENDLAMAPLWSNLKKCFYELPENAKRLAHPRLQKEREKQKKHRQELSEAGKRGAKSRWNNNLDSDGVAIARPSPYPITTPMAKNGFISSSSSSDIKKETRVLVSKESRAKQFPEDFILTEEHLTLAFSLSVDAEQQLAHFKDWALANGKVYKNWNAAFRNWLRNAATFKNKNITVKKTGSEMIWDEVRKQTGRTVDA